MNNEFIERSMGQIDMDAAELDDIVNRLVTQCCKELDDYVSYVKELLDDERNPISDSELDDFILTIPTLLYFVGAAQENLGIREDVAKMIEAQKYHEALIETSGTVANKQAMAKLATQDNTMVVIVYQRATKQIKSRIDAAYEVLQSAKKVLSRRISELELSKTNPNRNSTN